MVWLSDCGKKSENMFIHLDEIHECDIQTDGRTLHDGFGCAYVQHFLSFLLICGNTCSLCMPALRLASQAGPLHNPREGTSVVLHDTTRLT